MMHVAQAFFGIAVCIKGRLGKIKTQQREKQEETVGNSVPIFY